MEATARVIPLSGKSQHVKERPSAVAAGPEDPSAALPPSEFGALDGVVIVLPDEQLDAFGTIFCSSPLRRAMTFEGYLVAKGFGQPAD